MKSLYLIIGLTAILSYSGTAQNNITLNIEHRLGAEEFKKGRKATTAMDDVFTTDRLEYYLSEISISHDGGTITSFDSLWALVNANEITSIDLGAEDIDIVESISFHVGVNEEVNHADPTLWPMDHPLAPKSPSMHWGWSPGYRFIAFEGQCGFEEFQLHGLGDSNYFTVTVDIADTAVGGELTLEVYANYIEGLNDIDVSEGVIVHGNYGEAKLCLENFRDYVFSATEPVSTDTTDTTGNGSNGMANLTLDNYVQIVPNPASNGQINVRIAESTTKMENVAIELYDLTGKQVLIANVQRSSNSVSISGVNCGIYVLKITDRSNDLSTIKKVSVL